MEREKKISGELIIYSFGYNYLKPKLKSINGHLFYSLYILSINGKSLLSVKYERFNSHKLFKIEFMYFFEYCRKRNRIFSVTG